MTEPTALAHEEIREERERLDYRESRWLTSRGWTYTSKTPGCYWMWQKDWDGKTFLVSQETAVRIQGIWDSDEHAKAHPEEYED
jgi:hypothetical protein